MMDFFGQQEAARRTTKFLIAYFFLCVVLIVIAIYLAVWGFAAFIQAKEKGRVTLELWNRQLFTGVSVVTLLIIALGSLYKIRKLAGGGMRVARMLGGEMIDPASASPKERVLLNVVEEMAIASGVSVPPVYLLPDQRSINAFAAGFTPGSAVIGVTRGTMELLSRDELQGVVGHEFSHIFSGDMRLNIRLMGVIHGILVISIIGRILMRSRGKKNPLPLLGLGLFLIGLIGVFFGRLIKAAVSRQREFLADAASVQFTRNPAGIAGALKKIGGCPTGSRINHAQAEELSHFYFSNGLRASWVQMLATHPDMAERIRRIDPSFDGTFQKFSIEEVPAAAFRPEAVAAKLPRPARLAVDALSAVARVGAPGLEHLVYAAALIAAIPSDLSAGLRDPAGAQAVIFALLVSSESAVEQAQMGALERQIDPTVFSATKRFIPRIRTLGPEYRLPLVELAMPALARFSEKNYLQFRQSVALLIEADRKVDLFELMLQQVLLRNLENSIRRTRPAPPRFSTVASVREECAVLLTVLSGIGQKDGVPAAGAFEKGRRRLPEGGALQMFPAEKANLAAVGKALGILGDATPVLKRSLMEACVDCVAADGTVTVEEAELIRAVAAALDCPMPPILGPKPGAT